MGIVKNKYSDLNNIDANSRDELTKREMEIVRKSNVVYRVEIAPLPDGKWKWMTRVVK